jgi:putative NADH-flavin reductase
MQRLGGLDTVTHGLNTMKVLVTGSAGHLGEALMRALPRVGHEPIGVDINVSPFTQHVGSITDRGFVRQCIQGAEAVIHAATLHKPHLSTHSRQDFVDTNVNRDAESTRGIAVGWCPGIRVHQHNERVRSSPDSVEWCGGCMDNRRCRPNSEEHLWCDEGRG